LQGHDDDGAILLDLFIDNKLNAVMDGGYVCLYCKPTAAANGREEVEEIKFGWGRVKRGKNSIEHPNLRITEIRTKWQSRQQ